MNNKFVIGLAFAACIYTCNCCHYSYREPNQESVQKMEAIKKAIKIAEVKKVVDSLNKINEGKEQLVDLKQILSKENIELINSLDIVYDKYKANLNIEERDQLLSIISKERGNFSKAWSRLIPRIKQKRQYKSYLDTLKKYQVRLRKF